MGGVAGMTSPNHLAEESITFPPVNFSVTGMLMLLSCQGTKAPPMGYLAQRFLR
jgi:hypothetical protein